MRRYLMVAGAMMAVAAGGCGGGADPAPVASEERSVAAAIEATEPVAPPAMPRAEEPIASVIGSDSESRLELLSVRRTGPAVVTVQMRLRGGEKVWLETVELTDEDDTGNSVSGIRLVDEVNGRVHLPLRDAAGECLCSRALQEYVTDGDTLELSAKFPAPPAEVESVSVQMPTFPSFDQVPLG